MKIHAGDENIKKQLDAKEARLEHIVYADYPTDPQKKDAYIRKLGKAQRYLEELREVKELLGCGVNLNLVPRPTFEKQVAKADFATLEFDGEFCKIAIVSNFPFDNLWLIYASALESL